MHGAIHMLLYRLCAGSEGKNNLDKCLPKQVGFQVQLKVRERWAVTETGWQRVPHLGCLETERSL